MRKFGITTALDRYDRGIAAGATTWPKLVKKLTTFAVTPETFEQYMASGNEQLNIKDVGYYIGGKMVPAIRRKANLESRSILALDLDHLGSWDVDAILDIYRARGLDMVWHSSHKHSSDLPRLRLVFPFSRDVTVEEYEPIARQVASWAGMPYFDSTTFQVSRVMFWPSRSVDGEEVSGFLQGSHLDPDLILDEYEDWQDWGTWPVCPEEEEIRRDPSTKAADPFTKPGIIGAFNRLYSVPHAIAEFGLPYEPSGMGEDRYSFAGGTSVDGAIFYEDDGHLYSWHESDPAKGNRNAWDLVRIHEFGELDNETDSATPIGSRPSQKAMVAFAAEIEDVTRELASAEFEPIDDDDANGFEDSAGTEGEPAARAQALTYDSIRQRIEARPRPFDNGDRRKLITRICAAKLTPSEVSVLAALLKTACEDPAPSKQAILDEIKLTAKQLTSQLSTDGEISDIEEDLINEVLREHFKGGEHVRRFGRQYWFFDHGVWRQVEDDWVYGCMLRTFLRLRKERPDDMMELAAAVGEAKTSALTGTLKKMFDAYVTTGDADPLMLMAPREAIVNCRNGELHFAHDGSVEFMGHRPELFLTSQVPVDFDATALCPEWDRFCGLVFESSLEPSEMQRHLEELGGYLLQYTRWLKTWVLMHGPTNAGKTTIGKVFENLLGRASANRSMAAYDGSNSHSEAGLVGKLMLLDEDFARGTLLPDGFIKKVSEAKTITANPKNKDEFDFICRALPIVVSNHWPPTRDVSDAFRERALVFDFSKGIPAVERDDERARVMMEDELPGILTRFAKGFRRLRKRGAWDIPPECMAAREEWISRTDTAARFLDEFVFPAPTGHLLRSDLYRAYRSWSLGDEFAKPVGKTEFLERSAVKLGAVSKRNGNKGWHGRVLRYSE